MINVILICLLFICIFLLNVFVCMDCVDSTVKCSAFFIKNDLTLPGEEFLEMLLVIRSISEFYYSYMLELWLLSQITICIYVSFLV